MSQSPTLDFEVLLAPIHPDSPSGSDVRGEPGLPLFHQVKNARSQARELERRRDFGDKAVEHPAAHWRTVLEACIELLTSESKDLEVATYLIEALLREHGFAGLRDGFRLIRLLVEEYWDDLYPSADDSGVGNRLAQFYGLNGRGTSGTLIQPILLSPVTASPDLGPYSTSDFIQAQELMKLTDRQFQAHIKKGAVSNKTIRRAVSSTPRDFYTSLRPTIRECQSEFEELSSLLAELCGDEAPHTSNVRDALASSEKCVNFLVGPEENTADATTDDSATTDGEGSDVSETEEDNGEEALPNAVRTREHALRALSQVAEFYRRSEPHSPMSYACEQLVRWGNMSLLELTTELIPDPNSRDYFKMRIGAKSGPQE